MKNILIILLIIILGILLYTQYTSCSSSEPKSRINRAQLIGEWGEEYYLNLKDDSSYTMYCKGSLQGLSGQWRLTDVVFNSRDTITYLILQNQNPKKHQNEDWFKNYFFEINKVTDFSLTLTDLSAKLTVRRNHTYKLKKDL
jgi:hypothetical protein